MTESKTDGACRCRAVRFVAIGEPKWTANCHCRECRTASGSAFATYVCFADEQLQWTGKLPQVYESSTGVRRSFCGKCGTPVSYQGERWPGERHLFLGVLENPARFAPQADAYTREKLPWVQLDPEARRVYETTS